MPLRLILAAVIALCVAGLVMCVSSTQKAADRAKAEVIVAKQETAGAVLQADAAAGATQAVDQVVARERKITREVSRATETVRIALGDGVAVERAVAAWAAGVDGLRGRTDTAADACPARNRDPLIGCLSVRAQPASGDAAGRNARRYDAAARPGRPILRGRHDVGVDGVWRARFVDRQAL